MNDVPGVGDEWPLPSRIWGQHAGTGDLVEACSPLTDITVNRVRLLSSYELQSLVSSRACPTPDSPKEETRVFAARLLDALLEIESALFDALRIETGFSFYDCRELMAGTFEVLQGAEQLVGQLPLPDAPIEYSVAGRPRRIRLSRSPWGTIAVVLPQNAFMIIGVTAMLNALAAGNRVILRAPLHASRSAALLGRALDDVGGDCSRVSVVLADSRKFCKAVFESEANHLIHFMGSSRHAGSLLTDAFASGTPLIIDGEGNCWIYVDEGVDPTYAAKLLFRGALRYYGQTCTSVNGAIIHPSLYSCIRAHLIGLFKDATAGPLFDQEQASWCAERIAKSGGQVLVGGQVSGSLLNPTLVESPARDSDLVRGGLFGPALWIIPGDSKVFSELWPSNRYPLCAGVLSPESPDERWASELNGIARLSINGDPSIESVFEPWGGYPQSGVNPVGPWIKKYSRVSQIDEPA